MLLLLFTTFYLLFLSKIPETFLQQHAPQLAQKQKNERKICFTDLNEISNNNITTRQTHPIIYTKAFTILLVIIIVITQLPKSLLIL